MPSVEKILDAMRNNPKNVRFSDLKKVCDYYFGNCKVTGSHYVYKKPWEGDPRVNIQKANDRAKKYQVKQVLVAIEKLKDDDYV